MGRLRIQSNRWEFVLFAVGLLLFDVILLSHRKVVALRCESAGNDSKAHCQHYKMGNMRLGIRCSTLFF